MAERSPSQGALMSPGLSPPHSWPLAPVSFYQCSPRLSTQVPPLLHPSLLRNCLSTSRPPSLCRALTHPPTIPGPSEVLLILPRPLHPITRGGQAQVLPGSGA